MQSDINRNRETGHLRCLVFLVSLVLGQLLFGSLPQAQAQTTEVPSSASTNEPESSANDSADALVSSNGPVEVTMSIEQAFNLGMGKLQALEFDDAIKIFRAILALNPELPRVRLELARSYFFNQDWGSARAEFFLVLSDDVPPAVKQTITQFLRAIEVNSGWRYTFQTSLVGNDAAFRQLSSDRVTIFFNGTPLDSQIDQESLRVGLNVVGSVENRRQLWDSEALGGTVFAVAQAYANIREFNGSEDDDWLLGSQPAFRLEKQDSSWSLGPDLSIRYVDGELFESRAGLRLGYQMRTIDAKFINASATISSVNNHLTDLRDAMQYSGNLSVTQTFGGRTSLTGALSVTRLDARAGFESFDSYSASLAATRDFGNGYVPTLTLSAGYTLFDDIPPTAVERRKDWLVGLNLSVIKNDLFFFGLNPFVTLGVSRRFSNNAFFDFTEYDFVAGLRKAF